MYKDFLFDLWFLEAEENEKLKDEIEDLEDENEELREELKKRKLSEESEESEEWEESEESEESDIEEIDLDEVTYFIEDIQNIALENWKDIVITNEEARRAINLWFSPEEYYEYRLNNWSIQE